MESGVHDPFTVTASALHMASAVFGDQSSTGQSKQAAKNPTNIAESQSNRAVCPLIASDLS